MLSFLYSPLNTSLDQLVFDRLLRGFQIKVID